jgi:hypothetical protein
METAARWRRRESRTCSTYEGSQAVDELPPKLVRAVGAALATEYGAELMNRCSKHLGHAYEGGVPVRAGELSITATFS